MLAAEAQPSLQKAAGAEAGARGREGGREGEVIVNAPSARGRERAFGARS